MFWQVAFILSFNQFFWFSNAGTYKNASKLWTIKTKISEYFWKDFYGVIPPDALPGGTDLGGEPTYIGQSFLPDRNVVVPTIIEKGSKNATINLGNVKISTGKNTKVCRDFIFCKITLLPFLDIVFQ